MTAALPPLLKVVRKHDAAATARGLTLDFRQALETIAGNLGAAAKAAPPRAGRRAYDVAETARIAAGHDRLSKARKSVVRVTPGRAGAQARTDFGTHEAVTARDPVRIAAAIDRFVDGAKRHPEIVARAGLLASDLDALRADRETLAPLAGTRAERAAARTEAIRRREELQIALEQGFERIAAVFYQILDDSELVPALRLIPSHRKGRRRPRRAKTPAAAAVVVPVVPHA